MGERGGEAGGVVGGGWELRRHWPTCGGWGAPGNGGRPARQKPRLVRSSPTSKRCQGRWDLTQALGAQHLINPTSDLREWYPRFSEEETHHRVSNLRPQSQSPESKPKVCTFMKTNQTKEKLRREKVCAQLRAEKACSGGRWV